VACTFAGVVVVRVVGDYAMSFLWPWVDGQGFTSGFVATTGLLGVLICVGLMGELLKKPPVLPLLLPRYCPLLP
jgi:hypothetical protein